MNLFAECIHIFNIKLRAVVENDLATPKSVNLMCFHTEQVERKQICVVVVVRLHSQIKSAVLRNKMPFIHPSGAIFRVFLKMYCAYFMAFTVIEYSCFGCI